MLFNSYDFLFGLLPVALIGHHFALREGPRAAMGWLVAVSLFFYGWWYVPYLLLLFASVGVNFQLGKVLASDANDRLRHTTLVVGVTSNLLLLGWFKYANFLGAAAIDLIDVDFGIPPIALPLAISFFTFQQIAYLVDTYKRLTKTHDLLDYALFVSFFPQLVAGPIVHHGEVLPQFAAGRKPTIDDRTVGFTLFLIGLGKKLIVADSFAGTTNAIFYAISLERDPTFWIAWTGTISYHLQLYFDFSGYSDMAIGLARMFGVKLPANFDAPYRAVSIPDFWRRWHITLSRFLRDYIYIPLGGNRRGELRRNINLFATMFLGGIWHGAGWTYMIWGALHGFYLLGHHWWRRSTGGLGEGPWAVAAARAITTFLVLLGWPIFRGADMDDALRMLGAMFGQSSAGFGMPDPLLWLAFIAVGAFTQLAPTSQRLLSAYEPVIDMKGHDEVGSHIEWRPTRRWAIVMGLIGLLCVPLIERADAFLYWNF